MFSALKVCYSNINSRKAITQVSKTFGWRAPDHMTRPRPAVSDLVFLDILCLETLGVQAYHFGKNDFELGVGGEGQDTSQHFEGSFGSIRAILPM